MNYLGLDVTALGLIVAVVTGLASFWLGRRFSNRSRAKREAKQDAAAKAAESRQVRRARERREKR